MTRRADTRRRLIESAYTLYREQAYAASPRRPNATTPPTCYLRLLASLPLEKDIP